MFVSVQFLVPFCIPSALLIGLIFMCYRAKLMFCENPTMYIISFSVWFTWKYLPLSFNCEAYGKLFVTQNPWWDGFPLSRCQNNETHLLRILWCCAGLEHSQNGDGFKALQKICLFCTRWGSQDKQSQQAPFHRACPKKSQAEWTWQTHKPL